MYNQMYTIAGARLPMPGADDGRPGGMPAGLSIYIYIYIYIYIMDVQTYPKRFLPELNKTQ